MRVVIPYRKHDDGLELRYAIRSMYKHFKGITGVLLIGDTHEWYKGDHLPAPDETNCKEYNMMLKVRQAEDEVFLYSNNDFFALQDFDTSLPFYYEKTCAERSNDFPYGSYKRMYDNCPGNWLNYDVHCPMVMDSFIFRLSFSKYVGIEGPEAVIPIKTMYGNYKQQINPNPSASYKNHYLVDLKIKGDYTLPELKQLIKGRPFFGTTEAKGTLNKAMLSLLNELYPQASPCESV